MAIEKEKTPKKSTSVKSPITKVATKPETPIVKKAAPKKAAVKKDVPAETPVKAAIAKKVAPKAAPVATKTKAVETVVKTKLVSVTFQLNFATQFGQSIFIVGDQPALGLNSDDKALPLSYIDQNHWAVKVTFDKETVNYYYIIKNENGSCEKSAAYHLAIPSTNDTVNVSDAWNYSGFEQNAFSTDVFKVLNTKTIASIEKAALKTGTHQFKIKAPQLAPNQVICILGDTVALNNWNPEKAILLFPDKESGFWKVNVTVTKTELPIQYKYGIYDIESKSFVAFEDGENRQLLDAAVNAKTAVINDGFFRTN